MEMTSVTGSKAAYTTSKTVEYDNAKIAENSAKTTEQTQSVGEVGATYEKSDEQVTKGTYTINRMSAEDRAALIEQLKADQEQRQSQLAELVARIIGKQADAYSTVEGLDIWRFLADGKFTVDEATRAKAAEDISEDGYWGVKQTSQRLFDFALALAGDDVEKMKEMQAAMEKGFEQATKTWGKELPQISHDTLAAANRLFEEYYND